MLTSNKGFTLIEMMIVVTIIFILVAMAAPLFTLSRINAEAEDRITRGVTVSQVKNEKIRNRMIKLLADDLADIEKKEAGDRLQQSVNNTTPPVLKDVVVPQSVNNTTPPVLNNSPKKYTDIQCGGDGILKKCTLLFRQGKDKFLIPMACELTDSNSYVCEVM